MAIYTLPIDLNVFPELNEDDKIDMSRLNFPVAPDKQKRASFIFIRNTNLKCSLDFHDCSYKDKEEFLLMYMTSNINVSIPELSYTWINILGNDYLSSYDKSILSKSEIDEFCKNNEKFVFEMRRLTVSLPVLAINIFNNSIEDKDIVMENDLESTDFDEISLDRFADLLDHEEFLYLIFMLADNIQPVYYKKYFNRSGVTVMKIEEKLPFINMMNMMFGGDENSMHILIDNITKIIESD